MDLFTSASSSRRRSRLVSINYVISPYCQLLLAFDTLPCQGEVTGFRVCQLTLSLQQNIQCMYVCLCMCINEFVCVRICLRRVDEGEITRSHLWIHSGVHLGDLCTHRVTVYHWYHQLAKWFQFIAWQNTSFISVFFSYFCILKYLRVKILKISLFSKNYHYS